MTTTVSLFQLAAEIAQSHERSQPGVIAVVPVIVDDLKGAKPVLQAMCEVLQGRFFDAADVGTGADDLQEPFPATADPVRREAVLTALVASTGRRVLLKEVAGDLLDAELDNPPSGVEQSAGDRAVLALARAVVHRDLDHYEFAILSYESGAIDLPFRRAVWQLMANHLSGMPSARLRTLLVVTESAIDIDLHCRTEGGFRFAVSGTRLLRRQGRDDLMAMVGSISRQKEPFVFFLGAGFAASSRLPLGDAVRDAAIRRLLTIPEVEFSTSQELARRFYRWIADRGWLSEAEKRMREEEFLRKLTLERVVRVENRINPELPTLEEFREKHDSVIKAPGSAVLDLASIMKKGVGRIVVVEVNFDLLVESHAKSPVRVFASDEEFSRAAEYLGNYLSGSEETIPILKIHGTITDFKTCIVSEDRMEQGVGEEKLSALRALLDKTSPRLWIYVGVSMRDRDVLRVLMSEEFGRGIDERWVSPYLVDTIAEYAEDRSAFWRETGHPHIDDRMVTETADSFFSALAGVWKE